MRHGALIYNPASGRRRGARLRDAVVAALGEGGWRVEPLPTRHPGHATELARELASAGGVEVVFALGGDGTLREVGAGLLGSAVALGPLPGGTANVLARALGLPPAPLAAARALAGGRPRPINVGLCGTTPFLMMVSAGLDAAVVGNLSGELKARWGVAAVLAQGVGAWWRYGFPPVIARWPEGEASGAFACVCNIPLYGGPLAMAPAARFDDDLLDLVLLRTTGRVAALGFAGDLLRGRHLARPDVLSVTTREVELLGPAELPLQVDGDACRERLPARVRLGEERLRVLLP
jgi:diacylglycerol kinase family enzyme